MIDDRSQQIRTASGRQWSSSEMAAGDVYIPFYSSSPSTTELHIAFLPSRMRGSLYSFLKAFRVLFPSSFSTFKLLKKTCKAEQSTGYNRSFFKHLFCQVLKASPLRNQAHLFPIHLLAFGPAHHSTFENISCSFNSTCTPPHPPPALLIGLPEARSLFGFPSTFSRPLDSATASRALTGYYCASPG